MKLSYLKDRSNQLKLSREFFEKRGLFEVDAPHLLRYPSLDAYIDLIETKDRLYLHSSPEYYLKKLLALGAEDVYFLGHVFRKEEKGSLHSCEFTLVEWYRKYFSLEQMIQESCEYIRLFIHPQKIEEKTYRALFQETINLDPFVATKEELNLFCEKRGLPFSFTEKDSYLHLILSHFIEPILPKQTLLVVQNYPASQAALAKICKQEGFSVAKRFEIYYAGVELANGYEELCHSETQRDRFFQENALRITQQKAPYPIDEAFLSCLDMLPPCCGVAVGFDRLMLLRQKEKELSTVIHQSA